MRNSSTIVLASMSPRRKELLESLELRFEVIPSNVDETVEPGLTPEKVVTCLAEQKASEVFSRLRSQWQSDADLVVIGADTIVVLDGEIIGKPNSEAEARQMLAKLSGRCHIVFTGVCVIRGPAAGGTAAHTASAYETSRVYFRQMHAAEIAAYVQTGEPMDKAGAYALQGTGSMFVEKIEGCYTNIIGLPIPKTVALLRDSGVVVLGMPESKK